MTDYDREYAERLIRENSEVRRVAEEAAKLRNMARDRNKSVFFEAKGFALTTMCPINSQYGVEFYDIVKKHEATLNYEGLIRDLAEYLGRLVRYMGRSI